MATWEVTIMTKDETGNDVPISTLEKEEEFKPYSFNQDIYELILHHTTVPYEFMNKELYKSLGTYSCTSLNEWWNWNEEVVRATPDSILWKAYGLCCGYWKEFYQTSAHNESVRFKKYRREHGDSPDTIICTESSFDISTDIVEKRGGMWNQT